LANGLLCPAADGDAAAADDDDGADDDHDVAAADRAMQARWRKRLRAAGPNIDRATTSGMGPTTAADANAKSRGAETWAALARPELRTQ